MEFNMNQSTQITRDDLMSLEQYAEKRPEFRQQVLAHKKYRQIMLGPNATLYFEDRLTLLYQIQEMLRIEKVFEAVKSFVKEVPQSDDITIVVIKKN
jgi:hypothetical protein